MATDDKVTPSESVIAAVLPPSTKTRRKTTIDAALASAIPAAVQQLITAGYPGVAASLQHDHGLPQESTIQKTLADNPVYIHWSKSDMATSFRVDPATKRSLFGALRGYRMARASHGTNSGAGAYYYEVLVLAPPLPSELLHALPSNARLGNGLREQLEAAVAAERAAASATTTTTTTSGSKKRKLGESKDAAAEDPSHGNSHPVVVSHIRLGWSMRTADLQAPVGYDKWSYGIRSVNGALVHESVRRDGWGGDAFGEGDIIGCYISLDGTSASAAEASSNNTASNTSNNNIRFFKNGECLGEVVLAKGKLDGGFAFQHITPGTYYPAVSTYMGASVRANFGPYFIYPPKKRLGIQYKPMSSVRPAPSADTTPAQQQAITNIVKLFKKTEHQTAIRRAIEYEAGLQVQAYQEYVEAHVEEVRTQRQARGVPTTDLPAATPAPGPTVAEGETPK